jgi:hypothetical protein
MRIGIKSELLITGGYTAKLWLFLAGLLMMAAGLFYHRLHKRMAK